MTLEVIGAGYGRTGTLSLKIALETLGYNKTHHMVEVLPDAQQLEEWHAISLGGTPNWEQLFEGYSACVDFPSSAYWRELAQHYPSAKIILTTRSFESWYDSASQTIYPVTAEMPGWLKLVPKARKLIEFMDATIWNRLFDGRFEDIDHTRGVFTQHEADVQAEIPPERLLVFHPKEGWEPLCNFLGKPVPTEPFPNVNDKAAFRKRINAMKVVQLLPIAVAAIALVGALIYFI